MSELVKALEAQGRAYRIVDAGGMLGIAGKPIGRILFMAPTIGEQSEALRLAYARVAKECGQAKDDPDALSNEKALCMAYVACRNPDNPKEQIFGSPEWMSRWLSADQIDWLVTTLNEVRYELNPAKPVIGDEAIALVHRLCDEGAGTDVPGAAFAGYDRTFLTHALVMSSLRIRELEVECQTLTTQIATATSEPPSPD